MANDTQLDLAPETTASEAAPSLDLPRADKARFRPLRAGIMNIWQYENQELRFHQGRLILRGENGTGKSKALELLLPFLLDADLSPHRLDPFAGTARTMRWNLLEGGRHDSRLGYVWLELGRQKDESEGGGEAYLTLGCGLRATSRVHRVDSWYFVTDQRVGESLELLTPSRLPLSKDQLRRQIEERGTLFTQAGDYRERVDTVLYGLGEDRYASLRHLLLQLRRPHLSEKLNPQSLSELLTDSLPPLDRNLIEQLSEGFQRLEHDEAELARLRESASSVQSFLEIYREYCRGLARVRAADVRTSESRYHKTAAQLREAEEELRRIEAELERLKTRERELEGAIATTRGTLSALEKSEAMQAAEALQAKEELTATLERQATRYRGDAERLERLAGERRADQEQASESAAKMRRRVEEPARRAAAAAGKAGLDAIHEGVAERLASDPENQHATVHRAVGVALTDRREAVTEVREMQQLRDQETVRFDRREARRRDADGQLRAAVERHREASSGVEQAAVELDESLTAWADGLSELSLTEQDLSRIRNLDDESSPRDIVPRDIVPRDIVPRDIVPRDIVPRDIVPRDIVSELVTIQRDVLIRQRAALEGERQRTREEQQTVREERIRVEEVRDLGPSTPAWRRAEREGRPGVPFYRLCEFAEAVPLEERTGLEAALEASGLLDAWVTPEGQLLDAETLDTVLRAAEGLPRGVPTLAEYLVPVDEDVVDGVADRILRSIAVGAASDTRPHGLDPDPHCLVNIDGSWQLGPLHGRWTKDVVEHIGASQRREARRKRLAELDALLAALDTRLTEFEAESKALEERLSRLAEEARTVPSASALHQARLQAVAAGDDELRRRRELAEAEAAVGEARALRDAAQHELEIQAQKLRLSSHLHQLDDYLGHLSAYQALFAELVQVEIAAQVATRDLDRARHLASEAADAGRDAGQRASASARTALEARSEVDTLRQSVGQEAREIVARHRVESERLTELEANCGQTREERSSARELRARAHEQRDRYGLDVAALDTERQKGGKRLRRLAEVGALGLVLSPAENDEDLTTTWTLSRTLEIARRIEQVTQDVDLSREAANRRANRLHGRYQELAGQLGGEFHPSFEHDDDLQTVRVGHNQRDYDVPALHAMLEEEIERRRELLAERERELLRRFLLGEVGDHLRHRLRGAHELIDEMNRLLLSCQTASGMMLKLSWKPSPDAGPLVGEALRLLRQDLELLSDADRRTLERFFEERIEQARHQEAALPWQEHLMQALDFRRWHRFRMLRRVTGDGEWRELTRHGHAAASGGEKAVALHLPLFAAAAAHYRSARAEAPRLILLDEAFAGIDQGMRGRCMGLLVELDLDFMMTSHDEWGCYEELPGVATYQLYRHPSLGGVAAIRCVWNGHSLVEE